MSIRIKLFLFIGGLLIVAVWSIVFALHQRFEQTIFNQTTQLMEERTRLASQKIDQSLSEQKSILQAIAFEMEYNKLGVNNPQTLPFLRSIGKKFEKDFPYIDVAYADKTYITTRRQVASVDFDPTETPWYIGGKNSQEGIITEPYTDIQTKAYSFSLTFPINLEIPGVLSTDLHIDDLKYLAQKMLFHPKAQAIFITKSGTLIYATSEETSKHIGANLLQAPKENIRKYFTKVVEGKVEEKYFNWNGVDYYVTTQIVPTSKWVVVTFLPVEVLYEESNKIIYYSIIISILALLVAFAGSFYIINRLTKPLGIMANLASELGKGNMEISFPPSPEKEINTLAMCLEDMRCRIVEDMREKDHFLFETAAQKDEIQSLYQQMVALNQELENAFQEKSLSYVETIKALADAIEAKDLYTRGHSDRVLRYAKALGEKIGLAAEEQKFLSYAAILHDVGKIGISSAVINKPDKLTPEEYNQIKEHPTIGYKILSNIGSLKEVAVAVLQHHEKVDGKGYPHGLMEEQIVITAKILAIADSYDAMTSSRSYRQALDWQQACVEIRRCAGTQFDYDMAHVFCKMVEENPKAFEQREVM